MRLRATAAFAILLAGAGTMVLRAEILEEIVAKINDQVITKTDMEEREGLLVQDLFQKFAGEELDRKMEEGRETLLRDMMAERLLLERAETLLDMEKVRDSILKDFMRRNDIPDRDQLARILEQEGLTLDRFLESLVRMSVPQEILNFEVRQKVEVPEPDQRAYYQEHLEEYRVPETVEFRELVILVDEVERDAARERIAGYRQEVVSGGDFVALIAEHSDAPSRNQGGLVGPFRREDLVPAIAEVVFALREGDLSEPVEMSHGFHLIRQEHHQEETVRSFEEVRPEIRETLLTEILDDEITEYLKKLWRESYVYIYPRYRERLPQDFLEISDLGAETAASGSPATP